MYLEEITYYKNICCPQFTPINYFLGSASRFRNNEIAKAVMLSELPVIFKKHNIPLSPLDLILFLNPDDNIADFFDIEEVLQSINSEEEEERKGALLTKDFFDFYRKIEYFDSDRMEKLLLKAVNERYGYNYLNFEMFKQYLASHIPESGYFDIRPLTEKDFIESKITLLDRKEQSFRRHFYHVKLCYPKAKMKFLSERFFLVYHILKDKYSEIEFEEASVSRGKESLKEKVSSVYLNDLFYEEGPHHFYKDYIPFVRFTPDIYVNFPEQFRKDFSKEKWDRYQEQIKRERFHYKKMQSESTDSLGYLIDTLEAERVLLEQNGYQDAVRFLPPLFQNYFRFSLKYEQKIDYFKNALKDTSNQSLALYNMMHYYGAENIPKELISYLTRDNLIDHHPIKKLKLYKK